RKASMVFSGYSPLNPRCAKTFIDMSSFYKTAGLMAGKRLSGYAAGLPGPEADIFLLVIAPHSQRIPGKIKGEKQKLPVVELCGDGKQHVVQGKNQFLLHCRKGVKVCRLLSG